MAGMSFANAFLGICHSMAHKLGSFHHLPHGVANALLINEVIRYNAVEVPTRMGAFSQYEYPQAIARYAQVADHLGLKGKTDMDKVNALVLAIDALKKACDIKSSVKEYGVSEEAFAASLDEMAMQAFDDQCTGANPRYPLVEELKELYWKAYHGA